MADLEEEISDGNKGAFTHNFSWYTSNDNIDDELIVSYFLGEDNHLYLLQTFAGSVSAFMSCFELLGVSRKSTGYVFSEFARRVEQNGCAGTDYGTTASLFVIN
jgi:hypothetical protein